jgi:hypothetical protein
MRQCIGTSNVHEKDRPTVYKSAQRKEQKNNYGTENICIPVPDSKPKDREINLWLKKN